MQTLQVIVLGPCVQALNYAWRHCGLGCAGPLQVWNPHPEASVPFKLGVELEGYSEPATLEIPAVGPGQRRMLQEPVRLALNVARLRAQVAPAQAHLRLWVNGVAVPAAARAVWVLGPWDWPHQALGWHSLGAYVCPRHPVVRTVAAEAAARLGQASFDPILCAGGPEAERHCLQALYEELTGRQIHYVQPRVQELPGGTVRYQNIRPPHEILAQSGPGQGTCLDLSLLLAGCLEQAGLNPLVIFSGSQPDAPEHCLVGCWVGTSAGLEPVLHGAERLRELVRGSNQVLAVESTGVSCTGGVGAPGRPLSFQAAVQSAREQLARAGWACAVNVVALRPPAGTVLAMGFPFEPVVQKAYEAAKELARAKRQPRLETTHLFLGLLKAEGPLVQWLFQQIGKDLRQTLDQLEQAIQPGNQTGEPAKTDNYRQCEQLAEDFAVRNGSPAVREPDLLWALLIRGKQSEAFQQMCQRLGLDLNQINKALANQWPCPPVTSSSSFGSGPPA